MSDRFKPYAAALVAAGILIALAGTGVAETAHPKKGRPRDVPQLRPPLPVIDYVRCAASLGDGPCAPDPSMQRLFGDPPFERPRAPQPYSPDFAPTR
jgi:hypothetical protein